MDEMEAIIRGLLQDDLVESAEKICTLFMSSPSFIGNESKLLELHGDCLFASEQFTRALGAYQQARNPPSSSNTEGQQTIQIVDNVDAARIQFKQCQCMVKTGDAATALREMESVPRTLRTTKMNVFLGRLYKTSGLRRHAISVLQEAMRASPFAIECAESLVSLGISSGDVDNLLQPSQDVKDPNILHVYSNAIVPVVRGHFAMQSSNYDGESKISVYVYVCACMCVGGTGGNDLVEPVQSRHDNLQRHSGFKLQIEAALRTYPSSVYLHTQAALAAHIAEKDTEALMHFRQVRLLDRLHPTGMDVFAVLLHERCQQSQSRARQEVTGLEEELSLLASDLLSGSPRQAMGWVAAALYTELKGDRERAMLLIDKVRTGGGLTSIWRVCCFMPLLMTHSFLLNRRGARWSPGHLYPSWSRAGCSSPMTSRSKPPSPSRRQTPSRRVWMPSSVWHNLGGGTCVVCVAYGTSCLLIVCLCHVVLV